MSNPEPPPKFKKGDFIGLNLNIRGDALKLSRYFNHGIVLGNPVPPQGSTKTVEDLKAMNLQGLYVYDEGKANQYLAQLRIGNWTP